MQALGIPEEVYSVVKSILSRQIRRSLRIKDQMSREFGIEPLGGWIVSCDSRLAREQQLFEMSPDPSTVRQDEATDHATRAWNELVSDPRCAFIDRLVVPGIEASVDDKMRCACV